LRAPMSGQTHELAGRILLELEGSDAARPYYATARGLDPMRAHVIESDLARIDALEGNWAQADARLERLLADPDPSIHQLGMMGRMRMASWRGRLSEVIDSSRIALSQTSVNAGMMFTVIDSLARTQTISPALWARALAKHTSQDVPIRQLIGRTQMFAEIALLLDHHEYALQALELTNELGLIDRTWLEHCPLLARAASEPRFEALRGEVHARAERVVAAFRSVNASA
jgi:hypothetical protein